MVGSETFRLVMRRHAAAVSVITMRAGRRIHGMTATAFASVSADPPLVLFCVHKGSSTHRLLRVGGHVGLSFLSAGQQGISQRFARKDSSRYEVDDLRFDSSPSGVPLVSGACGVMELTLTAQHEGGDHSIFVGSVNWARGEEKNEPLLYHCGQYATIAAGHIPRLVEYATPQAAE